MSNDRGETSWGPYSIENDGEFAIFNHFLAKNHHRTSYVVLVRFISLFRVRGLLHGLPPSRPRRVSRLGLHDTAAS